MGKFTGKSRAIPHHGDTQERNRIVLKAIVVGDEVDLKQVIAKALMVTLSPTAMVRS